MLNLSTWRIKPMSKQRRRHSAEFKFQSCGFRFCFKVPKVEKF